MKTKTENKASIRMRSRVASARITSWGRGLCLAVALTCIAVPFSSQAAVSENFDSLFSTSYSDQTSSGWRINSGLRSGSARSGSCARTASAGSANYLQYQGADGNGKDGGVGAVTFWYRAWDTSPQPTFKVQYSVNGGAFTDLGSSVSPTTTYTLWSNNVNNASDNIIVRIQQTAGERMLFDDAYIGDYAGSGTPPSVTTVEANATNTTTATPRGNVTDQGSAAVTDRGVCYKTSAGVAITDNKTQSGSGTGAFSVNLSSLSVNTKYYFKAYAINTAGTTLGSELSFTTLANTPSAPTVNNPTTSSLDITINENGNPASTEFAIQRTSDSYYLQANGTWGASAVWQTKATWGSPKTATGLSAATTYSIRVIARNGENVQTAFSSTADGTTCFDSIAGIYVNPTNETNFTINWSAVSGASGYVVDVSTSETFSSSSGGSGSTSNIIISELSEIKNNYATDRYLEIFNAGGSSVDLSGWTVDLVGNGSVVYTFNLSGTIASSNAMTCGMSGNTVFSPDFTGGDWSTWNGGTTDGAVLKQGASTIDSAIPNASYTDSTLTRAATVGTGVSSYASAEWDKAGNTDAGTAPSTPGTHDCTSVPSGGGGGSAPDFVDHYSNRWVSSASTSLSVTGLTGGVTYYFRITATNANCSVTSDTGDVTTPSAATSPEIAVLGTNRAEIVSADDSPAVSDGTDFQTWEAAATHDHIFTITNSGNGTLTLTGQPSLSGDAAFSRQADVGDLTLAPGQAETFTIRFTAPASPGSTFTSLVTVASDDSNEGTYTFAIKGDVAAPEIAVLGTNLSVITSGDDSPAVADGTDFQSWAVAATHDHIFTITNTGNGILTLSGQPSLSGDAAFSRQADVGDLTLSPGQAEAFTIRFTAPANPGGVYTSLVTVASNDGDEGTYTFAIRAEVPCFTEITGVYASETNTTDFTLAWSAVTGASGYLVDVSTEEDFGGSGGAGATILDQNFNAWSGSWIDGWTHNSGVLYASAGVDGSYCVGMNAANDWIQAPARTNIGTLSFAIATSSDPGSWTCKVQTSPEGADTWTDQETIVENGAGGLINDTFYVTNLTLNLSGAYDVRWLLSARSADSCYIDDVVMTEISGGGLNCIPGYTNRWDDASPLVVTGLSSGVTYYYRVTATNVNCSVTSSTGDVTTVVVLAPEIAVLGTNLAEISSGDHTPAVADGTDFGQVENGTAVTNIFTITNLASATANLILTADPSITLSGSNAFTIVTQPASTSLAAGATTTFAIKFAPTEYDTIYTGMVTIANNDTSESLYVFKIQGSSGELIVPSYTIRYTGFEGTADDNWSWVPSSLDVELGPRTATNAAGDYSLMLPGSQAGNVDPSILFDNVKLPAVCSNISLSVSYSTGGADANDDLYLDYSYDNGSTWETPIKLVDGYNNANIPFNTTNASNPTTEANPYVLSIPNNTPQIRIRIRYDESSGNDNRYDEYYIDEVKLVAGDDLPTVKFDAAETIKVETDTSAFNIPVTISSSAAATVQVAIAGTAAAGSDFTATSTNLVFSAGGATTVNLQITLTDDNDVEGPEMVRFTLVQAGGAKVAGPDVHTLFIRDDEGFSIVAANLVSGTVTVNGETAYDDPGQRLLRALAPDIVAIQEWVVTNSFAQFVEDNFGADFYWISDGTTGANAMPNGIISRWPFLETNVWADAFVGYRDHLHARIDLPGDTDLNLVSVHFNAGSEESDITARENEARALTNFIATANFGSSNYLAIAGDLNTSNRSEVTLTILTSIVDDTSKPKTRAGSENTNPAENRPYDYVLPDSALQAKAQTVYYNGVAFADGFIFDTREWGDHQYPALAYDSRATNLTHRPVMKVFELAPPDAEIAVLGTNLAEIADEDYTVSIADGTDFGEWYPGTTHDHIFSITNTGPGLLVISEQPTLNGDGAFTLQGSISDLEMDVGQVETFTIRFSPTVAGSSYTGMVTLTSNDPDEGTYNFAIAGSASCFTSAPVVLEGSASATSFLAQWEALTGAAHYLLDVSTNASFGGGASPNLVQNPGFETGDFTSWSAAGEYSVESDDPQSGSYEAKCVATDTRALSQQVGISAADGSTAYIISYWYRVTAGDGSDVRHWSTWDNGTGSGDSLQPGTYNATEADWTQIVLTNTPASGATNLDFQIRVYGSATVYLDDFSLTQVGDVPANYVPGYSNLVVSGTSESVTGLVAESTYYYRVMAVGSGSCVSAYSDTQSVVTVESTATWDGEGADKNWDTDENWEGDVTPGSDAVVFFYSGLGSGSIINLNGNRTVKGLVFNEDADTSLFFTNSTLSINWAGIRVDADALGSHTIRSGIELLAAQSWSNASAQVLTLSGAVSGSGDMTKTGSGQIMLSGDNTLSGDVTISGGSLQIRSASALGATGAGTTVEDGAALEAHGGGSAIVFAAEPLTLNGMGVANGGALRFIQNNVRYSGPITLGSDAMISVASNSPSVSGTIAVGDYTLYAGVEAGATLLTLSGAITTSEDGIFVKTGPGNLYMSGNSVNMIGDFHLDEGEIRIGSANALGNTGTLRFGTNVALKANSSTDYTITRPIEISGGITLGEGATRTGSLLFEGDVDLRGGMRSIAVDHPAMKYAEFLGTVSNGGLQKEGTGLLILSGTNTYALGTAVNAGTLQGTTDSLQGNITNAATVEFRQADDGTYAGLLSGPGNVNKEGAGTVTFSGHSPFTGLTRLNEGTLLLTGSASNSAITVSAGTTFRSDGEVDELTVDGSVSPVTTLDEPGWFAAHNASFGVGGEYVWDITNCSGTAGTDWDLITSSGTLTINASEADPFTIKVVGNPTNFNPQQPYSFKIVDTSGGMINFSETAFTVDTSEFVPDSGIGYFKLANEFGDLMLQWVVAGISVLGTNSATILNGETVTSLENGTDFGDVGVNSSKDHIFTVTNSGYAALTLDQVAVAGANSEVFTITAQPETNVAGAGFTTFTVTFTPTNLGERSATIYITNSIPEQSPYTFDIVGEGIISPPTWMVVYADGSEMIRAEWSNYPGHAVMIVHNTSNAPAVPTQGTDYAMYDPVGADGSRVIYKGSSTNDWEHVVPVQSTNFYTIYSVSGDYYSPGSEFQVITQPFVPDVTIQEPFSYTNGLDLAGHDGGWLWDAGWTVDGTADLVLEQYSLTPVGAYPSVGGNHVASEMSDGAWVQAERDFGTPNTTRDLYMSWVMNVGDTGTDMYAGVEVLGSGGTPLFMAGLPIGQTTAGIQSKLMAGEPVSNSAVTVTAGDDYTFILKFVQSTKIAYLLAYTTNDIVQPAADDEPLLANWHAVFNLGAAADEFYGIRLVGGGTNDESIGTVRWDELRVTDSWTNLLGAGRQPVWDGGGNQQWFQAKNWVGNVLPQEDVEVVVFYEAIRANPINFNPNAASYNLLGVRFDYRAEESVVIQFGGATENSILGLYEKGLEIQNSGGSHRLQTPHIGLNRNQEWSSVSTNVFTINSGVVGTGHVNKVGSGRIHLGGSWFKSGSPIYPSAFSGTMTISGGVISIQGPWSLGTNTAGTVVKSGAALEIRSLAATTYAPEPLTLSGTGIDNDGALRNMAYNNNWPGPITLAAASRIHSDSGTLTLMGGMNGNAAGRDITFGGAGNITVSSTGIAANVGRVIKDDAGTFTLSTTSSWSGVTLISNGVFMTSAGNVMPGATPVTVDEGATFNLNNYSQSIGALSGTGSVTLGVGMLTIGSANMHTEFGGVISGSGGLTNLGSGSLTITGTNTYSGTTEVQSGTLIVNGSSANSAHHVQDNGTLRGVGTVGNLSVEGVVAPGVTNGARGTLNCGTLDLLDGGEMQVDISSVTGSAGTDWDLLNASGAITVDDGVYVIRLGGALAGFSSGSNYAWTIISGASVSGFSTERFSVNSTAVTNDLASGEFVVIQDGNDIVLTFTTAEGYPFWDGEGADSLWSTAMNWEGDIVPSVNKTVQFYSGIGSGTNIDLNGNRTVRGMRFTDAADTSLNFIHNRLTLNGGGITVYSGSEGTHVLNCDVALGASQVWTNESDYPLTVNGVVSGYGELHKSGDGPIVLTGNNTFSGGLFVDQGVLEVKTSPNATGADGVNIGTNATLLLNGNAFTWRSATTWLCGMGTGTTNGAIRNIQSGTITWPGDISLGADSMIRNDAGTFMTHGVIDAGTSTLYITNVNTFAMLDGTFTGSKTTGAGALQKSGSGILVLRPSTNLSGGITLAGGTLRLADDLVNGEGFLTMLDRTLLQSTSSLARSISKPLKISGNVTMGAASSFTGDLTFTNTVDLDGAVRIVTNAVGVIMTDVISNGGLTKSGNGTMTLSGANTYAGGTIVTAGTLVHNATNTASAVTVSSGGTLLGSGEVDDVTVHGTLGAGEAVDTVGTLTAANVNLEEGGKLRVDFTDMLGGAGTDWDLISASGNVTVNASLFEIEVSGNPTFDKGRGYTNTIVDCASSLVTFSADKFWVDTSSFVPDIGFGSFTVTNDGSDIVLIYVPGPASEPLLTTLAVSNNAGTSAMSGGNILSDGGATVTNRGVVWSTAAAPTISDSSTSDGDGTGYFYSTMNGLTPGITYYVRAYAENSAGFIGYGNEVVFAAECFTNAPTGLYANPTNTTGFTANWDAFPGATGYSLEVYLGSFVPGLILESGFDDAPTPPDGWEFSGVSTYTTLGNYGDASPSLKFDNTYDYVTTPILDGNPTGVTFWIKGQSVSGGSALLVEGYNGSIWSEVATVIPTNDVSITNLPVASSLTRLRFTYTKVAGNLSFDDVAIYGLSNAVTYVDGYEGLPVSGTSHVVTGLLDNTEYYFRLKATNEFCVGAYTYADPPQITTIPGEDERPPRFFGFAVTNATGTIVLDRDFSGFPLFVSIADSTTGVRWTTAEQPTFAITNPSNAEVVAPTTFETAGHSDRVTNCVATGMVSDISASFAEGPWTVSVWAEDMNDYGGSSNFTFMAVDDDTNNPVAQNFRIYGDQEGLAVLQVGELLSGSGWWMTGQVYDADSGINVDAGTPYVILYDPTGQAKLTNVLDCSFADGEATTASSVSNSTPDIMDSAMAGVWTAMVYVADNDADGWTGDSLTTILAFTFTVEGTCPPIPVNLHADPTNIVDFTAVWDASLAAEGYVLDVSTNSTFGGSGSATDLIISEYIEGSGNNKYLEIYNGTGASIDLGDYTLRQYNNGSGTPTYTLDLSGTLAPNATYVIENSSEALGVDADLSTAVSLMTFNGNDAIALAKNSSNIDVIGTIGNSDTFAADVTKVRKSSVTGGTTTYDSGEWDDYPVDTVDGLGAHSMVSGGTENDFMPGYSNLQISATSQIVTGLTYNSVYYFRVKATNTECATAYYSPTAVVTTRMDTGLCADIPTNLVVTQTNATSFVLEWDEVDDAVGYTVDVSLTNDFGGGAAVVGDLFISEVADPGNTPNAKFVELYNATDAAIDFDSTSWYINRQANGGTWASVQLEGTIAAGGTFVIANSATYDSTFGEAADQYNSNVISGNGNDGYFLSSGGNYSAGTIVDAYGEIDVDGAGEAWEYTDGHAVRNADVVDANDTWTAAEWTITGANAADMTPNEHTSSASGSYVPGYAGVGVLDNEITVTGLEPDVEYFFRVAASNIYCAGEYSVTGSVITVSGPFMTNYGINALSDVAVTDGELAAGFTNLVLITDKVGGIDWTTPPTYAMTNQSGVEVISTTAFAYTGYTQGVNNAEGTGIVAAATIPYANMELGSWVASLWAVDTDGNERTTNYTVTVTDDDTAGPEISDFAVGLTNIVMAGGTLTTNISENFAGFTTLDGSADRSGSLDTYMQTSGWSGTAVYEDAGEVKLGASSSRGTLTTPTLDLSADGGHATFTFDARSWPSDATVLYVYVLTDGVNAVRSDGDITLTESTATYTNLITNGTSACKVQIYAKNSSSERFNLDNWLITQGEGGGGEISALTDGQIFAGGYGVTTTVTDADSGILAAGSHYYLLYNEDSDLASSNHFESLIGSELTSTGGPAISASVVTLGTYTGVVVAGDADDDRPNDAAWTVGGPAISFTVIDDDTNAPVAGGFQIEDSGATWDSRGDLVLTGIVTDVSGVDTGGMYFLMYDEDSDLIWSNNFVISGSAADDYWVSSTSTGPNVDDMCGGVFTINVVAVDGDLDRGVEDTLGTTNFNALIVSVIGEGGAPPAVTNLTVADEEIVDEFSLELTDEDINTGGYDLSMIFTHEDGLYIGGGTPAFIMYNDFGTEIMNEPFTNIVDVVEGTYTAYYATNLALPGVAAANVDLGQYAVTWSASNQGACIAVEMDSGLVTGGANVFTVVDDDADEPEVDAFAAAGQPAGVSTVSEEDAAAGFSITGLVRDVLSGIDITTTPPTYTIYNPASGLPMGGYEDVAFDSLSFGQGEATDFAAIGATGITLPGSCGVIYTVVVSVADADADRATGDQASLTDEEVLVIQIEGETEGSLDADGLFVNTAPVEDSNSATVYDDEFVAGSWTMSFAVASTDIVIDGPNKPTFTFYDETNGYVYGGEWDTITQDGGKIYATNAPMDPSPNTNFPLGAYRVYWSGRATGLCYASATESGNFGAAYTNIINVEDDDPVYPVVIDNFSVAGGAVTGGVGFIGCDDARTNLVAGDIAIIGMNTYTKYTPSFVNQDSFAFVATVGIPAGTEIKFTDNGWHCGALYGNEGTITWTATNCVEPGTVIIYEKYSDPYDEGSTATVNIGQLINDPMFSLNIRNEELIAYQGDESDPTFLYALDTSITVPGVWETCPLSTSDKATRTALPPGLQNGLTAVCVSNYDDVVLNTNTTSILGNRQAVLEYIGDYHNWIGHDETVYPLDTWDFTFPELGSVGGTVTDEDILFGRWDITGQVYDVDSGLSQESVWYMAFNTSGVAFISGGYFTNAWNPPTATQNLNISTVEEANSYENVTIGTNNYVTIAAMDLDADRGFDSLTEYLDIYFTVVDDDINPPFFDYLTWNGGTSLDTNQALAGDISVTARVNDIQSGIAFETAPPYILVLDADGNVAASNVFNVGSLVDGDARDSNTIVTTLLPLDSLGCGTYTAHVIIVDADVDRLDDRLMTTNSILLDMAGNSVPVDNQYITAAGVELEALAGEVTDGMINTGGWDMAVLLSHPFSTILLDAPDDPQYQVHSAATNWLWSGSWTNGTTVGTNYYGTNIVQELDPGNFDMIDTGVYQVVWWAVSEDSCDPGMMGTNQMLVVDDDITPPEWTDPAVFMTNNGVTYSGGWTNVNDFTIVWSEASDADTGFEYRRVLNTDPTTNTVMGVSLGTNNVLHITDAALGQTTNWIYAVDTDDDRPHDRLKAVNTNFVTRFDNVPPDSLYIGGADKGPDASSEIALSWEALSGGGGQDSYGQPLSPWASYRIFYEVGADPSTNSPYFDVAEYANLGDVGTDSVILSNLAFGAEYHLDIAGVDEAGNVGELMFPATVTLLAFNMTQAVTRVNTTSLVNAAHLSWTATNEMGIIPRAVDLIYVDAVSFTAALSNQWQHATTITNDTWAMEDSLNIPAGRTRFYRAAIGNSWMTNRNPRAASKEVWGIRPVTLYPGQNWVALHGRPINNTVIDLIGTNLPAGSAATSSNATKISWYARSALSAPPWWVATQQVALVNDGGNYSWAVTEGGATWGNGVALPLHEAFVIEIPSGSSPQTIYLVGQVPTNTLTQSIQSALSSTAAGRNLISLNLPKAMHPSEMGLLDSGFKGGIGPAFSDQLWKYDRVNQKAPYAVWYSTALSQWRLTTMQPVPTNYFSPDDGIYMWIKNSTNSNWNLTQPLPYTEPSIRMNP